MTDSDKGRQVSTIFYFFDTDDMFVALLEYLRFMVDCESMKVVQCSFSG